MSALTRLRVAERYHPGQLRAPRGTGIGGQWVANPISAVSLVGAAKKLAAAGQSSARVSTRKSHGGYDVQHAGADIGHVRRGSSGWWASAPTGSSLGAGQAGPHSTRRDAIDVLVAAMPQTATPAPSAPPRAAKALLGATRASAGPTWPTSLSGQVMNDLQVWVNAGAPANSAVLRKYTPSQMRTAGMHLGLSMPGGGSRRALEIELERHAQSTLKSGDPVAVKPLQAGRVGVAGATAVPRLPRVGQFGPNRQSLDVHLGSQQVGSVHELWKGYWDAEDENGTYVSVHGGHSETDAIKAVLDNHQFQQTAQASGLLATAVPGVTLRKRTRGIWGNAPDAYDVLVGGVDIGTVSGDHSDPNGDWEPQAGYFTTPTGSQVWPLQNPGGKPTRDAAIQEVVDSYNLHQLSQTMGPQLTTTVSGVTLALTSVLPSGKPVLGVDYQGFNLGAVTENPGGAGWMVWSNGTGATLQGGNSHMVYGTKDDAIDALVNAHNVQQMAQAWSSGMVTPAPTPQVSPARGLSATGVTVNPTSRKVAHDPNAPGGTDATYEVQASAITGVVGRIYRHSNGGGWYARYEAPWSNPSSGLPLYATRKEAAEALALADRVDEVVDGWSLAGGGPHPLGSFSRQQLETVVDQHVIVVNPNLSDDAFADVVTFARNTRSGVQVTSPTPTPSAPTAPSVPATPQVPYSPTAVADAQAVIYGTDPKAKTVAKQLSAYGGLRKSQFDQLDPAEQSVLLGDLSYIASTSKGANATKAQKLIDRFTPPGTPLGTVPTQSAQLVGPATGSQTRLPAPQAGLLKQAKKSGTRGDTWIGPSGSQVWGEYGSGGLLLRHVDAQGVERFLMTQRGPGISDPGKWSYPGGAFESLEDFYQGSTREVAEELGWTDADFASAEVHGHHVFERADVKAKDGKGGTKPWTYHSVAATVPTMMTPHLSTSSARAETSDAKWLTRAEIARLDSRGELHAPVAGGKLEQNVMTLFPSSGTTVVQIGAARPPRLTGTPSVPKVGHKPSLGRDLVGTKAAQDQLLVDVAAKRKTYTRKVADPRLAIIGEMQGYDDVPTVVDKAEMDRLLATGDYIEAWRGMGAGGGKTAAQIQEEMRSGPAYYGNGMFGQGYYLATDRKVAAGRYADGTKNSLLRILIPKTAKIEGYRTVLGRANKTSSSNSQTYSGQMSPSGLGTLRDPGRYASAAGLDGIELSPSTASGTSHIASHGLPAYTWVNRSVLIIQEADP